MPLTRKRKRSQSKNSYSNNSYSKSSHSKSSQSSNIVSFPDPFSNRFKGKNFGFNNVDIGMDPNLENLIKTVVFATEPNENERAKYISQIPLSHPCEWGEDFKTDPDTYFLLQIDEYGDYTAKGAVLFDNNPKFTYNNIPFYYIDLRCSWGAAKDMFHTYGRLLWAKILHEINSFVDNGPFVVYNDAIPTAAGYHFKMGMRNLKEMIDDNNEEGHIARLIQESSFEEIKKIIQKYYKDKYKRFKKEPNTEVVNKDIELGGTNNEDLSWNRGNMFYIKRKGIDYEDLRAIMYSLSEDSEIFSLNGSKKKSKTNKRKRKRQKKKGKRRTKKGQTKRKKEKIN